PRRSRLAQSHLGRLGTEPPREVLQPHQGRAEAAGQRGRRLAPPGIGDHDGRELSIGSAMNWISRIRNRFRAFTDIQAVDGDLDDEVTAHLEAAAAEYQTTGLSRKSV